MYKLPKTTLINQKIPKKTIYENCDVNTATKNLFVEQIQSIYLIGNLSERTLNIEQGSSVQEVQILQLELNKENIDYKILNVIKKSIPYHIVFILKYEEKCKFVVYHVKRFESEWMPIEDASIQIQGLNLDTAWANIVMQIEGIVIEDDNTLEEQIAVDEQKAKLEKEIVRLEKQARAEKQPKKKFELVQEIKRLKARSDT